MGDYSRACLTVIGSILLLANIGASQLPCNHPLRISAPSLFSHCTTNLCSYTTYSDWQTDPNGGERTVSTSQCPSGKTYQEIRTRTSTSGPSCTDIKETRRVCYPDQEDKLILALELGGSDQNLNGINKPSTKTSTSTLTIGGKQLGSIKLIFSGLIARRIDNRKCPANNNVGQICHHLAGKRSATLTEEFSPAYTKEEVGAENMAPEHESPVPFEWEEHGPRLRRQTQRCFSNEVQSVLFVLDSSGSIGTTHFQRMKDAIGKLVPLFCKQVQFAMVTFSSGIDLEFCFDCFDNTVSGRQNAANAISKATYHNGGTNTGAATKCICEQLLTSDCGLKNKRCLDVVYITDGYSNDNKYRVCNEIKCLHQHSEINTYAIGIKNYNNAELDCISDSSNTLSAFQYESFDAFEASINKVVQRLVGSLQQGNLYSCLQRNNNISPTGAAGK